MNIETDRRTRGRLLIAVTLLVAAASLVTLHRIHHERTLRKAWNQEALARSRLLQLVAAERVFHDLDVDGNGVLDYWTGDIAGLWRHGLIDSFMAAADARPLAPWSSRLQPLDGYYYLALEVDDSADPPEAYRQGMDPVAGKALNRSRFGFMALPATYRVSGFKTMIINEDGYPIHTSMEETPPLRWPDRKKGSIWSVCWGG